MGSSGERATEALHLEELEPLEPILEDEPEFLLEADLNEEPVPEAVPKEEFEAMEPGELEVELLVEITPTEAMPEDADLEEDPNKDSEEDWESEFNAKNMLIEEPDLRVANWA